MLFFNVDFSCWKKRKVLNNGIVQNSYFEFPKEHETFRQVITVLILKDINKFIYEQKLVLKRKRYGKLSLSFLPGMIKNVRYHIRPWLLFWKPIKKFEKKVHNGTFLQIFSNIQMSILYEFKSFIDSISAICYIRSKITLIIVQVAIQ